MYYAAYGSNMNIEQMACRCPDAKVIGVGYIKAWKLYFNYHANIKYTGNKKDIIPILIWDISMNDFYSLNRYEGYPKYYKYAKINCILNNKNIKCLVYIMTENRGDGYCLPSESYLKTIAEGYYENDIKYDALLEAIEYTAANKISNWEDEAIDEEII